MDCISFMSKLLTLSGLQVRAILEAHGFVYVHTRGSHMKLARSDETGASITVIVPAHSPVKTGTLSSIIRQSGLGRGPFES